MYTPADFWNWFTKYNSKYYFLEQIEDQHVKDQLLDEFMEELQKFSDGLYFMMGGDPDGPQELIITAEGDPEYFDKVIELTDAAPQYENWEIIAFKPAQGTAFTTRYEDVSLTPDEMWFLPLQNPNQPEALGLRIAFSHFQDNLKDQFLFATYIVLDTVLGERSAVQDINYLEIAQLPPDFDEKDLCRWLICQIM